LFGHIPNPVRIERSRDARRGRTAAGCLDFDQRSKFILSASQGSRRTRHERIWTERLRHRCVGQIDIGESFGEFQRGLETVGEPRRHAIAHNDAIDDDLDVMLVLLVERGGVLDLVKFAVDADAGEAFLLPLREFLAILALASAHDGGEQIGARPFGQRHYAVDHLADRLRADRLARCGRIGDADARP